MMMRVAIQEENKKRGCRVDIGGEGRGASLIAGDPSRSVGKH